MKKNIFVMCVILIVFSSFLTAEDKEPEEEYKYGKVELIEIYSDSPDWQERAKNYLPEYSDIDYLQKVLGLIKIEVYFGHWCSDSVKNVPAFIKIMEELDNDSYQVEYWSVPEEKEKRKEVNGRKLEKVPTFIVFFEGKEVGRIIENPLVSIENDLANIFRTAFKEE